MTVPTPTGSTASPSGPVNLGVIQAQDLNLVGLEQVGTAQRVGAVSQWCFKVAYKQDKHVSGERVDADQDYVKLYVNAHNIHEAFAMIHALGEQFKGQTPDNINTFFRSHTCVKMSIGANNNQKEVTTYYTDNPLSPNIQSYKYALSPEVASALNQLAIASTNTDTALNPRPQITSANSVQLTAVTNPDEIRQNALDQLHEVLEGVMHPANGREVDFTQLEIFDSFFPTTDGRIETSFSRKVQARYNQAAQHDNIERDVLNSLREIINESYQLTDQIADGLDDGALKTAIETKLRARITDPATTINEYTVAKHEACVFERKRQAIERLQANQDATATAINGAQNANDLKVALKPLVDLGICTEAWINQQVDSKCTNGAFNADAGREICETLRNLFATYWGPREQVDGQQPSRLTQPEVEAYRGACADVHGRFSIASFIHATGNKLIQTPLMLRAAPIDARQQQP